MKRPIDSESQFATMAAAQSTATLEDDCSALAAAHLRSYLHAAVTAPLNVCLDDDSSIEDGDEDMFDDDAFAFGDEDFQELMSHESMRRMAESRVHDHGRPMAANLHHPSDADAANSHRPPDGGGTLVSVGSSHCGRDSMPSTAASSSGESETYRYVW